MIWEARALKHNNIVQYNKAAILMFAKQACYFADETKWS